VADVILVAAVVVGAFIVTRMSGFVIRRLVRRVSERTDGATRWWRARSVRTGSETAEIGEQRRRQRIDAAARMLNHVASLVVWIAATIAVFQLLDVDAAFFLSSAGFIGAAVAIGGQHKVNDYLSGLSVLFEDRYGVGDELAVDTATGDEVHAVVDHVGLVTTRLRAEHGTIHLPNASMVVVRNLSQEPSPATLRLHVERDEQGLEVADERSVAAALRGLAGSEQLTDVIFVGDLATRRTADGELDVAVKTTRPLDDRARAMLIERAEAALRSR
jgi:small conductance mechanosensitive channel